MSAELDFFVHYTPLILVGSGTTIFLFATSLAVGTALGLAIAIMRLTRRAPFAPFAAAFVWFFRGMPALVILFFTYYALPEITGWSLTPLQAGVLGLGVETAAYQGEVIRAGLISVDPGQHEAAQALGLSKVHYMRRIIIPQSIRVIVPPYFGSAMALLRTTAVASVITVEEMTGLANRFIASTFRPIEILAIVGLLYLAMSTVLQLIQQFLETRFAIPD